MLVYNFRNSIHEGTGSVPGVVGKTGSPGEAYCGPNAFSNCVTTFEKRRMEVLGGSGR